MGVELDIASALNAHMHTMGATLPVVFTNYEYSQNREPYIRATTMPRDTDAPLLGDDSSLDFGGVYQITINTKLGHGEAEVLELAQSVIDHFKRGTTLTSGQTTIRLKQPYRSPLMINHVFCTVVVTVPYRAIIKPL